AFNGIVGYKPTARRIPLDGGVPLSATLDSYGPIARSVGCCAVLDAVLADEPVTAVAPRPVRGLRFAAPTTVMLDDLDPAVASAFERALDRLADAGVLIDHIAVPEFAEVAALNVGGGFAAAESWAWHRALIAERAQLYDPRVLSRIRRGESISAADYVDLLAIRRAIIGSFERRAAPYDGLVSPTVAIAPPLIADLADDAAYVKANMLSLRNCSLINTLDGCAISLPCHREGEPPVGLMLAGTGGADRRIFELAAAIEPIVRG
ncbi:MAG TPA: amidase family protein, partial [Nitrobacter sp.]|nr:amidase family protein [Nitrobacter sp.]